MIGARHLSAILDRFVDGKFYLGNKSKGWDCVNILIEFYTLAGIDFPRKWGDYDESNYAERWKRQDCRKDFGEFLQSLGKRIENPNFKFPGDLMIFEGKEVPTFPGIFLGNGKVMMVFDRGVKIAPMKFFKPFLKEVRRLI